MIKVNLEFWKYIASMETETEKQQGKFYLKINIKEIHYLNYVT